MPIDPMTAALIGGGANLAGGLIGQSAGAAAQQNAQRAYQQALAQIAGVYIPTLEQQQVAYQTPELVGEYAPVLEQTPEELATAMAGIEVDPRLKQAQMQYLEQLSSMGETGMTAEERNAWEQIQRESARQNQAQQQAILQNMAQRGVGGSGIELAARLQAGQAASDRAAQEGMALSAQQQQRALQALAQAGSQAGQMRGQEFGEQSDVSRARDVMAQFNLQNALQTRRGNVEEQRQAQAANLQARQTMAGEEARIRNLQEQQNKALYQTRFANEMQRAQAMAGMQQQMGQMQQQAGQAAAQNWSNIGSGVGSAFTGLLGKKKDS